MKSDSRKTEYTTSSVVSRDGTRIGYRQYGGGPAIILVNGAIGTAESYHDLAEDLATRFTVYVPERRGRPLSPHEYSPNHTIAADVEDLQALFEQTGAHYLFGLSSGAVIALEAARLLPYVRKLVLFEPPLYVLPRRMRLDLVARYYREVGADQTAAAMLTALFASGLAPSVLLFLPRPLLEIALSLVLRLDARRKAGRYPPLRDLVPTMQYDFNVVSSMQNRFEILRTVKSDVLLLSCRKSAAYLRETSIALDRVLPHSQRLEFANLDHSSPWNTDRGGHPGVVAATLREFFTTEA